MSIDGCEQVVNVAWNGLSSSHPSPYHHVSNKLSQFATRLDRWNWTNVGHVHRWIEKMKENFTLVKSKGHDEIITIEMVKM